MVNAGKVQVMVGRNGNRAVLQFGEPLKEISFDSLTAATLVETLQTVIKDINEKTGN